MRRLLRRFTHCGVAIRSQYMVEYRLDKQVLSHYLRIGQRLPPCWNYGNMAYAMGLNTIGMSQVSGYADHTSAAGSQH
jgi:hypothetical protein